MPTHTATATATHNRYLFKIHTRITHTHACNAHWSGSVGTRLMSIHLTFNIPIHRAHSAEYRVQSTEYTMRNECVFVFVWKWVYKTKLNCFIHLCLFCCVQNQRVVCASSIESAFCCCAFFFFVGEGAHYCWLYRHGYRSEELWVWFCGLRCFLSSRLPHIYRLYFICTKRFGCYFSTFYVEDCPFLRP